MTSSVYFQMMGSFLIIASGAAHEDLGMRTRKGVSLLQYLVLERGKPVSRQRLIRELWFDRNTENPDGALKTMTSRLRAMLNDITPGLGECVGTAKGIYQWNTLPGVTVDVLEIMEVLDGLRAGGDAAQMDLLAERLLELYKGDLYTYADLRSGATFVNWLHREYLGAVQAYIDRLRAAEEYNRICEVCRRAMLVDDEDDQLHIALMQAMSNLNRSSEAMSEYRRVASRSRRYLDAEPSEELQACYEQVAEAGKTLRFNLDVIRNKLMERENERKGPFFCEYRAFQEIYNIQIRNIERLGSTMFLGVIMLGEPGDGASDATRESSMAGLQEILKKHLRKGDIVTRFSENIFAMLLPTVSYTTGNIVMERLEQLYFEEFPTGAAFHYRISPLDGGLSGLR